MLNTKLSDRCLVCDLYSNRKRRSRLWKEFMIDEGLETMNIGFLRGHVAQLTKALSSQTYHYRRKGPEQRAGGGSGSEIN